jgi:hypothetical protein
VTNVDAAAALLALLVADVNLTVYDGVVPINPATGKLPSRPYIVMWSPPIPGAAIDTLAGRSGWWEETITTTIVGDNVESIRIATRRVRADVLDVIPVVTGRKCLPIRMDGDPLPVQPDNDVQPPVLYAVIRWRCSSVPA